MKQAYRLSSKAFVLLLCSTVWVPMDSVSARTDASSKRDGQFYRPLRPHKEQEPKKPRVDALSSAGATGVVAAVIANTWERPQVKQNEGAKGVRTHENPGVKPAQQPGQTPKAQPKQPVVAKPVDPAPQEEGHGVFGWIWDTVLAIAEYIFRKATAEQAPIVVEEEAAVAGQAPPKAVEPRLAGPEEPAAHTEPVTQTFSQFFNLYLIST